MEEKIKSYGRLAGNSGVKAYRLGKDYIEVIFKDGDTYLYSHQSAGKKNVDEMKKLAQIGEGLSRYISKNARDLWEKKS